MFPSQFQEDLDILWNWVGLVKDSNRNAVHRGTTREDLWKTAMIALDGYMEVLAIFNDGQYGQFTNILQFLR